MKITINDRECEAHTGDRLLDAARANHSHIGYFCGGNALCQTCYVKVLEGHELLSPITDAEQAMLSDRLISEGNRMACQVTIEKPGTIRILSTVEEAKRMTERNPLELPAYMGKMGWEALVKFPETIAFQAGRENGEHRVELWQVITDVVAGIGDAIQLVLDAVQSAFGAKPATAASPDSVTSLPAKTCETGHTLSSANRNGIGITSPDILRLHEASTAACN
jgi:chlorosome envelope protein X